LKEQSIELTASTSYQNDLLFSSVNLKIKKLKTSFNFLRRYCLIGTQSINIML
jgi:hypothetical protein